MFVLANDNTAGDHQVSVNSVKKYFLPGVKIEIYKIETEARNFYDQPNNLIKNNSIKQNNEVRRISIGQSNDYTTGGFLNFAYFEKNYKLLLLI